MTRSIMVGDVRTGRRITQIPVSSASWSMVHRGVGEIKVDIPLGAEDFAAMERTLSGLWPGPDLFLPFYPTPVTGVWRPGDGLRPEFLAALDPARCFLAVLEDDAVLEAGPIWSWAYADGSNVLTVGAQGLRSLFDHRLVMGLLADWPGANPAAWTATYSGMSLGTIAKRLVSLAMSHTGGNLPIVLPDDETGSHTRTYYGYNLGRLGDYLDALMGVINGPDIALQPRLTADRMGIEWVLRTGTEADPLLHQHAGDWTWDSSVPRGGVGGISVTRDATALAERAWVSGSGTELSLLLRSATDEGLLDRGFPLMETTDARGTVEVAATADSWAAANLRGASRPTQAWTFEVAARPQTDSGGPAGPQLGDYRPGDIARVWVPATHPLLRLLLPQGFHRARLIRIDGGMGPMVKLTVQPAMEAR